MQQVPSVCDSCIHRISDSTCDAFPAGIPDAFVAEGEAHATPTTNQNNEIVWEFAPGTETEFQAWKEFQEAGS